MTKTTTNKNPSRRDGSSLLSLSSWLDEIDGDLADLTSRLRLARMHQGEEYHTSRLRTMSATVERLERTITGLLEVMPRGRTNGSHPEARFVCLGLIAQWLDLEARKHRSVQGGIQGSTDSFELSRILEFLSTQQKSGMLKVVANEETFYVEIEEGDIVHAASDNAPVGERLGEVLMELHHLAPQQLKALVGAHARPRMRMGQELLDRGWVTEENLLEGLGLQVRRLLARMCEQEDALFEFQENATRRSPTRVRLPTIPILLEIASDADEAATPAPVPTR